MHKKEVRALISAMLLGDGHLGLKYNAHRKGQNPVDLTGLAVEYRHAHCDEQKDYVLWKAEQVDAEFSGRNVNKKFTYSSWINKRGDRVHQSSLCWTKYLRIIYPKVYKLQNNERIKTAKWLLNQIYSDLHLFIWFGDDGAEMPSGKLKQYAPSYRLHINSFTFGEAELIKQWFSSKYGVDSRIGKYMGPTGNVTPELYFRTGDSKILWNRFGKYAEGIPSMRRKFRYSIEYHRKLPIIEIAPLEKEDDNIVLR